jgi:hypothetical protein
VAKAVELQTLAIEKAGDEDMKNEMKATLTKYQEKK